MRSIDDIKRFFFARAVSGAKNRIYYNAKLNEFFSKFFCFSQFFQ